MSELAPIWQSLLLAPVAFIGIFFAAWLASHFNEQPHD